MKPKVYVAGPYTKGDVALNVRKAIEAGNELTQHGFAAFVPHFTHFWHLLFPHEYQFWIEHDEEWISVCDYLLRLPGDSSGADGEVKFAKEHGIKVFYSMGDLLAWNN
jgi:hypothetical protein